MTAKTDGRRPRTASRLRAFRLLPATLVAVALLLTVRVGELWQGIEIGPASVAIAEEAPAETPAAASDGSGEEGGVDPVDTIGLESRFTEEEIAVLLDLSRRRDALATREQEIEQRSRLLDAAELRIDKRIAEMEALRTNLEALVRQYDDQEKAELESVVKIYETMKAKDAARILDELPMPVLMGIMETMKERKTAAILAEMRAEKAREVTAELARRNEVDLTKMSGKSGNEG